MSGAGVLRKLRGRSPRELAERGGQRLAAALERVGWRDARELTTTEITARLRGDSSGGASLERWYAELRAGRGAPFFAGAERAADTARAIGAAMPGARDELLARAERMLEGRFDLLGLKDVRYALPIDWHLEPVSGRRAPRVHWSRIDYLDPAVAGDHKVLWELNRHHVLVTLAQAYAHTGDERFARTALTWAREWMDANPPKIGVNWASSLEVSFRAIAWLWTLRLLASSPELTLAVFTRMVGHLYLSARHLERYLSTWFSPNTHLTGEALGLFYLGTQLAPFQDAARWRGRGLAILLEQLPLHVRDDGVYFEQATYYQRYTADFYLHLLVLAERSGIELRRDVGPPLERVLENLLAMSRPDGTMPLLGDDDGGRLLFLDGRDARDVRPPLALGALLFQREDMAYQAGSPTPELAWLLGAESLERFARAPRSPARWGSRAFATGGVYVMRDGWGADASVMTIDGGPHGVYNCGHAHADALSFDLTVRGRPLFVDPGTFTYTTAPEWRDHFRSTMAHNALALDGRSSSEMAGPFSWRHVAASRVNCWAACSHVDYFEAWHDGFSVPGPEAVHTRRVLFIKDGYWIVRDDITGSGTYEASATLQCATGLTVAEGPAGVLDVADDAGHALASVWTVGPGVELILDRGWVSTGYATREAAPRIRAVRRGAGPLAITTVIADASLQLTRTPGERLELATADGWRDTVVLDAGEPGLEGVASDGRVVWVRRDRRTGQPEGALALGGTHIEVAGARLDADGGRRGTLLAVRGPAGWRLEHGAATATLEAGGGASPEGDAAAGKAAGAGAPITRHV